MLQIFSHTYRLVPKILGYIFIDRLNGPSCGTYQLTSIAANKISKESGVQWFDMIYHSGIIIFILWDALFYEVLFS